MALKTDTFVAQEWTYLDMTQKNSNFFGTNPIKITSFSGFAPQQVLIAKFNIPDSIKKRKLKDVTLELPYNVIVFFEQMAEGFGRTSYNVASPGEPALGPSPEAIDLREITWNIYKSEFYSLLGETILGQGKDMKSLFLDEYLDGKSGVLKDSIWSDLTVDVNDVYYKSIFSLFKYNCIVINTSSSITSIAPNNIKLTIQTEDPSGTFPVELKSPNKGSFLRKDFNNIFKWELGFADYIFSEIKQKNATFQWKEELGSWNSIPISSSNQFIEVEKNTFPKSKIIWKVSVVSENDLTSSSEEQSFTTIDSISTAKAIYPKSIIIDNNKDCTFEWEHIINTGTEQTKAELEYKEEDKDWTPLITVEGNQKSALIKAGTFPPGKLLWRVRTYNMDNVPGNWSKEEEIVSRGSSPAPAPITANTSPRVIVEWQSEGQVSAEVRIRGVVYKVYGNVKQFKCPVYLADGEALIEVRILNEFDLWSAWGSTTTVIKNAEIPRIEVTHKIENYGVSMEWNISGVSAYIYRDGVLIAKTTNNEYVDYESVGEHEYYIMVGNSNGDYAYSEPFTVDVKVPTALLSKRYTGNWIVLDKKRGSFPSHKIESKVKTTYQFYAGRKLPVAYQSDNLTRVHKLDFSFRKRGFSEKVAALSGEEVVYKDCRGDIAVGVMDKVTQDTDTGTDIDFQITETSDGEIEYD